MSRPRISRSAQADLEEIRAYIAEHGSPRAAARWISTLRAMCHKLAGTPGIGRSREELGPGLRSFAVGEYVIFYREIRGLVVIVHVLHGARDIDRLFHDEGAA